MKEKVFKEEMKGFNISIDDIEPSKDIFGAIDRAVMKMRQDYLLNRLEVVLNDNLIESKDKLTNYRTILGCRVSYDDLPKEVSFIVREDTKPTYDELEHRIDKAIEYIKNNNLYEETRLDYDIDDEPFYWDCDDDKAKKDLLSILRGD